MGSALFSHGDKTLRFQEDPDMSTRPVPNSQDVFDPRGLIDATPAPLAPRKTALTGLRLGILDNTKWNANKLLRGSMSILKESFGFERMNYYRKESFSRFARPELISEIALNNDVVLTAIGD
jgi:hypothetical protein